MIRFKNIKYDKENGIITASIEVECDGIWHDISVDTKTWSVSCDDYDDWYMLGKCRLRFQLWLMDNEEIPSKYTLAWY